MRVFRFTIASKYSNTADIVDYFEFEDDATEEEIDGRLTDWIAEQLEPYAEEVTDPEVLQAAGFRDAIPHLPKGAEVVK